MTTNNVYDPAAIQHEFTRKALRFFYADDDMTQKELDGLEEELPEYAETINNAGGYDLDKRIAALTAERDRLRDQLQAMLNVFGHPDLPEGSIAWYACDQARKELDNQT